MGQMKNYKGMVESGVKEKHSLLPSPGVGGPGRVEDVFTDAVEDRGTDGTQIQHS